MYKRQDYIAPYTSQTANYVLASPNGSAGTPAFRALVNADLPTTITATAATATSTSTAASLGYIGSPINTQASTYTLVIGDIGKTIYAGGNLTIPANGTTPFPVGTIINVIASAGITIAIGGSDVLQWGGQATSQTGTRTVATYGMVSLQKVTNTTWYISGVGVT